MLRKLFLLCMAVGAILGIYVQVHKMSKQQITILGSQDGRSITLITDQGPKVISPEFKVDIEFSDWSSHNNPVEPYVWLDDKSILTQKKNGALYTVGLGARIHHVVTIPDIEPCISYPIFKKNILGRVSYEIDGRKFHINLAQKSYIELK